MDVKSFYYFLNNYFPKNAVFTGFLSFAVIFLLQVDWLVLVDCGIFFSKKYEKPLDYSLRICYIIITEQETNQTEVRKMKKFMYDLKNKDTGVIEKKDLVADGKDLTKETVEFFFGGVDYNVVNVREIN